MAVSGGTETASIVTVSMVQDVTVDNDPNCMVLGARGEGRPQKRQLVCNNISSKDIAGEGRPQKWPKVCDRDRVENLKEGEFPSSLKWGSDDVKKVDKATLLDASVDETWFSVNHRQERLADGRSRLLTSRGGPVIPDVRFKGRAI